MNEKQLTADQIQELHKLVERDAVGYYDVQVEVVDHYATAIEAIWAKDPNVSFYEAQMIVYKYFWDFQGLVKDKKAVLSQQAKEETWIEFKAMFGWPNVLEFIVLSALLFISCSFIIDWLKPIYLLPLVLLPPLIRYYFGKSIMRAQKELGHSFLKVEVIWGTFTYFPSILCGLLVAFPLNDYLLSFSWGLGFFVVCISTYILFEKSLGKVLDKELEVLKKQYSTS